MKQRFSYLDLRLIVNELEDIVVGCRLQNVYSLEESARHFLFKFDAKTEGKTHLIVDPGFRIHETKYQHLTTLQPSGFVSKLRKHLKTRRVSQLRVPAGNRLLVMTFSDGQYYVVFEFFSGGNIILLDENKKILAVQRVVKASGKQERVAVGEQFSLDFAEPAAPSAVTVEQVSQWIGSEKLGKAVYSKISDPSSSMIEYCLAKHGLDPKSKEGDSETVAKAVQEALDWAHRLISQSPNPGYLIKKAGEGASLEFEPFIEYFEGEKAKNTSLEIVKYDTYNETVDEHFGAILTNFQVSRVDQLHKVAEARLDAARNEKENRVRGLEEVQAQNEQRGLALQTHAELVDMASQAVRQLIDQGMDWVDIDNLIKIEADKGNTVAMHIAKLSLERNQITLNLPCEDSETGEISVPIDLSKTSWANSRDYFDVKRAAGAKKEKTLEHAERAYKSAEKKIKKDLEKNLTKNANATKTLHAIRQPYWFEKFYWFLASDGTLVIGGRDDLQNELLLRRYFEKDDVYVHSDAPGAAVLIIKLAPGKEPSPQVLTQAASFCVASSSRAWDTKFGGPSWWISRSKVPRINSRGDPISVDDVSRGPRNTMLPTPIDMGLAFAWQSPDIADLTEDLELDSDEEFPDTQLDSDDEFPDTQLDSDDEAGSEASEEIDSSESAEGADDASGDEPAEDEMSPEKESSEEPESLATRPEPSAEPTERNVSPDDSPDDASERMSVSSSTPQPESRKVRGKNKKLKKMRQYLDQDEEDRQAAMERLGTLKGLARIEQAQKEKEEKRAAQVAQQKHRQERKRQTELDRINAEVVEDVSLPMNLTLTPSKNEDELLAAVPMFAPWSALQKAKYKVKIVPGTMKKGKATQEAVKVMLNQKDPVPTDKERRLIEAVRPQDLQMIVTVKTMQLGGAHPSAKAKGKSAPRPKKKK